ncbi:MAG: calcium-binding protein [bacterium]
MYIEGTNGNDKFSGYNEDNIYYLKEGYDSVKDYFGNDVYMFNRGDNWDTITDSQGFDSIKFGKDITVNDLVFSTIYGNTVNVQIKGIDDGLTIIDGKLDKYKIEQMEFADGSVLTKEQLDLIINNAPNLIEGTQYDDILNGTAANDLIIGKQGNDTLYGGSGDNTFVFNKGDGQDVITFNALTDKNITIIEFGEGITEDDLIFDENAYYKDLFDPTDTVPLNYVDGNAVNDMTIKFKNSTDFITLEAWKEDGRETSEIVLKFADGTEKTLESLLPSIISEASADCIIKAYSNDTFFKSLNNTSTVMDNGGNDIYYSSKNGDIFKDFSGFDTYVYNQNSGKNLIQDQSCTNLKGGNTLAFGCYITSEDLIFNKINDDLQINFINNPKDEIYIETNFLHSYYKPGGEYLENSSFDSFKFVDGAIKTINDFKLNVNGTSGDDDLTGSNLADNIIDGKEGNDLIKVAYLDNVDSELRNNIIKGGKGNDIITNAFSNDTYLFDKGDGQDIITDVHGNDAIDFGASITNKNISFVKNNDNLIINVDGQTDRITVNNWFASLDNQIETLNFTDGSSITAKEIDDMFDNSITPTVIGTEKNDVFTGYNGDDVYYAAKGYDRIKDYSGNDTYLFNKGDDWDSITDSSGEDKIVFGNDIKKEDIEISKDFNNLNIAIKGTNDGITVVDWFQKEKYQIETIQFNDGTLITNDQINHIIQQMTAYTPDTTIDIANLNTGVKNEFINLVSASI